MAKRGSRHLEIRFGKQLLCRKVTRESLCSIRDVHRSSPWPGRGGAKMQRSNSKPPISRIRFIFQWLGRLSHKTVSDYCATVVWKRSNPSPDRAGLCCVCRNIEFFCLRDGGGLPEVV